MAHAEGVEGGFVPLGEGGQAAVLADAGHGFPPPREDFVGVGLVAHVPDDAILRGVKAVVQGEGELDYPQAGAEVAAALADAPGQEVAELFGQRRELFRAQAAQRLRAVDAIEKRCRGPLAGNGFNHAVP